MDVIVWQYCHPDSIVSNQGSVFTLKLWSSLYYFLGIKKELSIAFHPQTDGQTKKQKITMETYLQIVVNFEQNSFWLLNLPIIMQKTPAPATPLLNWTVTTTFMSLMKKTLIFTPNPSWRTI